MVPRKNAIQTVQTVNCTECKKDQISHKMVVQRVECVSKLCNNEKEKCQVKYKTVKCEQTKLYSIYRCNNHDDNNDDNNNESDGSDVDNTDRHGFSKYLKSLIEEIIHEKEIVLPRKIRDHLTLNMKKYNLPFVPNLVKIQNYIKYRRIALGDTNNMEGVEDFVNSNLYKPDLEDEQMFFFGAKFGDGSDANHFQLGFTSKSLLNRLRCCNVLHIDATYKIVKYGFPLIIYGIFLSIFLLNITISL